MMMMMMVSCAFSFQVRSLYGTDRQTDGRTDGRTEGQDAYVPGL